MVSIWPPTVVRTMPLSSRSNRLRIGLNSCRETEVIQDHVKSWKDQEYQEGRGKQPEADTDRNGDQHLSLQAPF